MRPAGGWASTRCGSGHPAGLDRACGDRRRHASVGRYVGDVELAALLEDAPDRPVDLFLRGREVDDAVRDHEVDGPVGDRLGRLDEALVELDVRLGEAEAPRDDGRVPAGDLEELGRHVDAVDGPGRADPVREDERGFKRRTQCQEDGVAILAVSSERV